MKTLLLTTIELVIKIILNRGHANKSGSPVAITLQVNLINTTLNILYILLYVFLETFLMFLGLMNN